MLEGGRMTNIGEGLGWKLEKHSCLMFTKKVLFISFADRDYFITSLSHREGSNNRLHNSAGTFRHFSSNSIIVRYRL